jgi:hypothetical protein
MRRPSRGFENPEGLKFCHEGRAPLRMLCAQCGFTNQPQAKFCGECGAFLGPASRTSIPPTLAARSIRLTAETLPLAEGWVQVIPLGPVPVRGMPNAIELYRATAMTLWLPQAEAALASEPARPPRSYTPSYLTEKILTSRCALEGERKQVTVLFADLKGSMELLADRDPEEARAVLDPVLARMMAAVHRYEGTVNQVMGDGIMALFGAPLAHEDHAVRACYAALWMQEAVARYGASSSGPMGSRCASGSAGIPERSWCGPSAAIYTWIIRPPARPRTWRRGWSGWPGRGAQPGGGGSLLPQAKALLEDLSP